MEQSTKTRGPSGLGQVRPSFAVAWDAVQAVVGPRASEPEQDRGRWLARNLELHVQRVVAALTLTNGEAVFLKAFAAELAAVERPAVRQQLFARFVTLVGSPYAASPHEPLAERESDPRVWVGCLAAYNAGDNHGRWINLRTEDLEEAIATILTSSPVPDAEEWHICDQENMVAVGRYTSTDELKARVEAQETYGAEVVEAALGVYGEDHWREALDNGGFCGAYDSPEDWAYEVLEASGALAQVPEALRSYFDFEAYARDAACNGLTFVNGGPGVLVFE